MILFVSVSVGCPQVYVFAFYIGPVGFCYFHEIYSNLHPVDIFLPTDITLNISPISDIEFELFFKDAQI